MYFPRSFHFLGCILGNAVFTAAKIESRIRLLGSFEAPRHFHSQSTFFPISSTMSSSIVKFQALWRGYASRKQKTQPCVCCGYPVTVPLEIKAQPCSWCTANAILMEKHENYVCEECNQSDCRGDCEPYIPCRMCGANCYGDDYEKWRFCSRSCMRDWGRD